MRPFVADRIGTEMLMPFGGVAALLIGTGSATTAAFIGLGGTMLAVMALGPIMGAVIGPVVRLAARVR
jgi:hypothetical protein